MQSRSFPLVFGAAALACTVFSAVAHAQSGSSDSYGYGTHLTPRYQYSAPRSPSYNQSSSSGWGNGVGPEATAPARPSGTVSDPRLTRPLPGPATMGSSSNQGVPGSYGAAPSSGAGGIGALAGTLPTR